MHAQPTHPPGIPQQDRHGWSRRGITWSVAIAAVFGLISLSPSAVQARTFQCRAGDVACLITAIKTANTQPGPRHEIRLAAGTYILTVVDNEMDGPNGLPSITSQLTIVGAGDGLTILERNGSAAPFRLLNVAATGTLTLEGLTLRGGSGCQGAFTCGGTFDGGGGL